MLLRKSAKYILAYAMWIIFIALGFLSLWMGRLAITGLLQTFYIKGNFQHLKEVQFLDQVYVLITAITLLIFMIIVEEYFRTGVQKNRLSRRAFRAFGIELILVFITHTAFTYLTGFGPLAIAMLALELIAGCLMIWFGYRIPVK